MCLPSECIWRHNAPTLWMQKRQNAPRLIHHLWSQELCDKWGIWRGIWICSTPICRKATGLFSNWLPLVHFGVICVQKVCASGILCIQQVGVIWCQMQQRVNTMRHVDSSWQYHSSKVPVNPSITKQFWIELNRLGTPYRHHSISLRCNKQTSPRS